MTFLEKTLLVILFLISFLLGAFAVQVVQMEAEEYYEVNCVTKWLSVGDEVAHDEEVNSFTCDVVKTIK